MQKEPEKRIRRVVERCADCDTCRYLMDESCHVFPELYRLWDREQASGKRVSNADLRSLVELCHFCALCPCPDIRAELMQAKSGIMDRDGLPARIRMVEDVLLLGRICGTLPQLTNAILRCQHTGRRVRRVLGFHPERDLPLFPREPFSKWARRNGLHRKPPVSEKRKVAYFSGCSANVLFPEVARAAVALLRLCGAAVWVPPQKCCGMPTFLEGDRKRTLRFARLNLAVLSGAVAEGYDIVCSCPTCGYMLKNLYLEGAYYSSAYQASVDAGADILIMPQKGRRDTRLKKAIYGKLFKDDGYFAGLSPMTRIAVAEHTFDMGEYLEAKDGLEWLPPPAESIPQRMVYYAPCHLREQEIGLPYPKLLGKVSARPVESVGGSLYCCGMAGVMGCKQEFHERSLFLGRPLAAKLEAMLPDLVVTDCLSCRLQFRQMTSFPVRHPLEVLAGLAARDASSE